jgi:RND family efflux transporter MFP subunit
LACECWPRLPLKLYCAPIQRIFRFYIMHKNIIFPRLTWLPSVAVAGVLVLSACTKPAPVEAPIRAVKVITIGTSAFSTKTDYAGEVRARVESRLGFRVGGKITQRQAELGQRVKAGQVLAQLDPQDYRLAADAARAQVAVAATQRDLAAADYTRYEALKAQNFISGAELERRDATLKAANAQLNQAKAQLAVQGNQAAYAELRADASGVVTAVEAEPGQVVSAGTPVVRVAVDGVRDVVFAVPEDRLASIQVGAAVALRVGTSVNAGGPAAPLLSGRVREVAASSDPVTRTYLVKVAVDATPGAAALPLGATVYAQPQAAGPAPVAVIKLPTTALWRNAQDTSVWVLDKSSMTLKPQVVQIAAADGNEVVVTSGLQPGMLVVSAGVHVLAAGEKVTLYQPPAGPVAPAAQAGQAVSPASAPSAAK